MDAIQMPPGYWTVEDAGFRALVQPFGDAFRDVHRNVTDAQNALTGSANGDVQLALSNADGDADVIYGHVVDEYTAVVTTPADQVLAAFGASDSLATTAEGLRPGPDGPPNPQLIPPGVDQQPKPDDWGNPGGTHDNPTVPAALKTTPTPPPVIVDPPPNAEHFVGGVMAWSDGDVLFAATHRSDQHGAEWAAAPQEAQRRGLIVDANDVHVTRGDLVELLSNMDMTINVQV